MSVGKVAVAAAAVVVGWAAVTDAACRCAYASNQRQWICANSWDVPAGYCGGYCMGASLLPEETPRSTRLAALLRLTPGGAAPTVASAAADACGGEATAGQSEG